MSNSHKIWVIDDDDSIRWVLVKALEKHHYQVTQFADAQAAARQLADEQRRDQQPDVILTDIRMPGQSGIDFLADVQAQYDDLPVIVMTAHSDLDSAVTAYEGGAFEYLPKPFDTDEAINMVKRAVQHAQESRSLRTPLDDDVKQADQGRLIIGEAPAMQDVFRIIGRLAKSHITVMINGESGTGKELVAGALHHHSPRAKGPFIAINTAAIPKDLLESELFGHEKGAFTGAQSQRRGRFEQAHQGTLFLDEIGDMPADLQTRLLRVLADGEFYRVGGHTPVKVDVRIIAATHQNLEQRVKKGQFREDLFHRLNVIRVQLPALRERREDIPLLLKHFLAKAAQELSTEPKVLQREVVQHLCRLEWPGNVRQLENTCRWLTVMAAGNDIHQGDLPQDLQASSETTASALAASISSGATDWPSLLREWSSQQLQQSTVPLLDTAMPLFERTVIDAAMQASHGHRQEAARLLGWGRNTLTRKIKQLDIVGFED